jgi:hypothetical protein
MTHTIAIGRPRRSWAAITVALGATLGACAVVVLLAGPLGYRLGISSTSVALGLLPRTAQYIGAAAVAISLLGVVSARMGGRRGWAAVALVGVIAGGVCAYAPWQFRENAAVNGRINDITTDTENPPTFEAVMPLREAARAVPVIYGGASTAEQQRAVYPDIVSAHLSLPLDQAFTVAYVAVRKMGWRVIATDGERGRIEATDRTFWYGFTDDIVVRVTHDGGASRIDIRSKSRVGSGDAGTNARRIRSYLAALKDAAVGK